MQQGKPEKAQKVKTKVRFTSLDIAAMVAELQQLIGLRVSNIYDLNPTTYIFKIAKSQQKHQLLIENGVRFHLTEQKPDKKNIPSGFTMRFRRFLRSKRVENVRQVGVQRVVVISFGSQTFANHLILQLYSQGNIILTDHNYRILQCIRSHQFNDKVKTAVGQIYPFEHAANLYIENIDISPQALEKQLQPPQQKEENVPQPAQTGKKKGKGQDKAGMKVKDVVFKLIPCLFPLVIEHLLTTKGIDPERKIDGEEGKQIALDGAKACLDFLKGFIGKKQEGYLYTKGEEYFQFSPFSNCKLQKWPYTKQESFGSAVAEYFSKYKHSAHEEQEAFEELAWKKYEQIRKDQQQRVKKLVQEQQTYGGKAELIEKNVQQVEAVLKIIGTMQNNGYSWQAMQRMVAQSRKTGDPLANMIHNFNAPKRQITILLSDTQGEQAELCALIPVQLLVDYNAYTNATMYYQGRKKQQQKEQRTREASEQVLKLAEKDALKKIQKKKNQLLLKAVPTRKMLWFEKFYWFVTSDGWLVISGRDSHQNQLLVKRYMKPGDLYMHSDYGGAASTIIKGPPKAGIPPLSTLQQAAIFTVCRSKAWDTKIISSSWWVYHDQVSKSAPTGEFLPTGSFMIRGKRNFIHPNRMEMGFTLLYKLDNESMQRRIEQNKLLRAQMAEDEKSVPLERAGSENVEDEEYAIIDLQAEARIARQKKKQRINKQKDNKNKQQQAPDLLKKQSSTVQEKKQSEEENDEEQSEDEEEKESKKDNKKVEKKTDKKNDKKKEVQEVQQKHKNRNKKKLKKLQKYMEEQDDEERQIIMKMLGAKQMKHLKQDEQPQEKKDPNPKNKKDKKRGIDKYIDLKGQQQGEAIDTNKVLFLKQKKIQSSSDDENTNEIKELPELQDKQSKQKQEGSTEQAIQQGDKAQQQGEKQQEVPDSDEEPQVQEKVEEKVEEEEIDEKVIDSQFSQLNRLAGKVQGLDKWDGLIPMCAPYQTIKDNRFKVKLVPGGLKKGKAARNIQGYYLTTDLDQNEKAFVKALPQQEVINALIGNVKLAGAGLLKLEQKSKAEKKEKRKEADKKEKQ